jgi:hypothetical protein
MRPRDTGGDATQRRQEEERHRVALLSQACAADDLDLELELEDVPPARHVAAPATVRHVAVPWSSMPPSTTASVAPPGPPPGTTAVSFSGAVVASQGRAAAVAASVCVDDVDDLLDFELQDAADAARWKLTGVVVPASAAAPPPSAAVVPAPVARSTSVYGAAAAAALAASSVPTSIAAVVAPTPPFSMQQGARPSMQSPRGVDNRAPAAAPGPVPGPAVPAGVVRRDAVSLSVPMPPVAATPAFAPSRRAAAGPMAPPASALVPRSASVGAAAGGVAAHAGRGAASTPRGMYASRAPTTTMAPAPAPPRSQLRPATADGRSGVVDTATVTTFKVRGGTFL